MLRAVSLVLLSATMAGLAGCKTEGRPSQGDLAPDFVLQSATGQTRKLSNYRGQVVLVNLWATWCPPCIAEMPILDKLHEDLGPRGLVVLGIAGDEDTADVLDFLRKSPVKFEVLLDPDGVIGTQYGITGYPETFFVDRDGRLRDKIIGSVPHKGREPAEELVRRIEEMLGG
jgi:cytochrome c biogenesis protein CcmG/thiol:disulfide interchange protein DsbE